jgi:hypothetical protein
MVGWSMEYIKQVKGEIEQCDGKREARGSPSTVITDLSSANQAAAKSQLHIGPEYHYLHQYQGRLTAQSSTRGD